MLFVSNVGRRERVEHGEFSQFVLLGERSLNGRETNRLLRNLGGETPRFEDRAFVSGADRIEDGRGLAVIDIEGDGDLDLVIQNFQREPRLLVNQGAAGNWLQVRLDGVQSNRDGIGAKLRLRAAGRTQLREVSGTAGYLSGQSLLCHFGLGGAKRIESLVVDWPSGRQTRLEKLPVNQRLLISETGEVRPASQDKGGTPGR